jgi:hypothetical protein
VKLTRVLLLLLALALASIATLAPAAQAAPAPAWTLSATPLPSNIAPGSDVEYLVFASNVGAAATTGPSEIEASFPETITPVKATSKNTAGPSEASCSLAVHSLTCVEAKPVASGGEFFINITAEVSLAASGASTVVAAVRGGGAQEADAQSSSPVQTSAVPFSISPPGLLAPLTEEDGAPAVLAGSHPYQQTLSFQLPTRLPEKHGPTSAGRPRDFHVDLPAGLLGDPASTSVLCTEAQLESVQECPEESQVGVFSLVTILGEIGAGLGDSPLYNMVPPAGAPAELATNVAQVGLYAHIIAGVRSDGDYGIEVRTPDVLNFGRLPIFGIQTQIWGDPTSSLHDLRRGKCVAAAGNSSCPVEPQKTAFWTMPTHCDPNPITSSVEADTWEEPGTFVKSSYQSADLGGSPVSVSSCSSLAFEPTINAKPTTNLSDSPSGLEVDLHQPQDTELGHTATAQLKDATVTLPAGMSANPSQADGLAACSLEQIGFEEETDSGRLDFSKAPATCPDASKLGTVEITTPLLVERDDETKVEVDPETGDPILTPLHGSLYLAAPQDNPFGSLLAIYLTIEDPATGTVAKLAGEIETDPGSGQITTYFEENPQLPIEDIHLELFKGARAALITPPTCATHTTTTDLVPWSSPEAADATPSSSFQSAASPAGGACPSAEAALPNAPAFSAGTIGRQAGAFSPFVLKLSREDGTARLTGFDTLLPPGLTGKLAGIPACSDAALAQAASRSGIGQGALERTDPSCPAASALGTATVGAGAGPTPYYTKGTAYLAGPYKSAPLSIAVITPAIAGPFDLGVVVVRAALNLDPNSAQIHAVSDPLPTILHGIPLDLRSVAVSLDRPSFTLNPTSCDPMAITGAASSLTGPAASLTTPFQVGGCPDLPFKPKLSLTLKGKTKRTSHPTLIANLSAKPGEANIAKAQVKLPGAAFLDQGHIGTVCTRVQFAAKSCPPASVYGKVSATTPLLDYPLTGNVYLRSSTHQLPDLVADLNGPASQPIEIALAGRTDAVKGALRNTFEAVPDAPVSSFHLELFGGKKGLIILSAGLCKSPKAQVNLDGQNGKVWDTSPVVKTSCKKGGGKGKGRQHKAERPRPQHAH